MIVSKPWLQALIRSQTCLEIRRRLQIPGELSRSLRRHYPAFTKSLSISRLLLAKRRAKTAHAMSWIWWKSISGRTIRLIFCPAKITLAIGDEGGGEALTAQHDAEHLSECRIVVHHQYARSHVSKHSISTIRYPSPGGCRPPAPASGFGT